MTEKFDRAMRLAGLRPDEQGNRTWRVLLANGTTEDVKAFGLSLSAQDTATFHRGGNALVLTLGEYRRIDLLDDEIDLTEAEIDQMLAEGTTVEITGPPVHVGE